MTHAKTRSQGSRSSVAGTCRYIYEPSVRGAMICCRSRLGPAIPEMPMQVENKRRALRSRMLRATLASYGVDAVLLAGFALAGTIHAWVPVAYAGAGWLASGSFHWLCGRTGVAKSGDPYLTIPNLIVAALIQLVAIALAPQV